MPDASTSDFQRSTLPSQDEMPEVPLSLAATSLLEKKINTILCDPKDLVVDRSDPSSPLYSLKSFQDLNLKPDLLKGNFLEQLNAKNQLFCKNNSIVHYF